MGGRERSSAGKTLWLVPHAFAGELWDPLTEALASHPGAELVVDQRDGERRWRRDRRRKPGGSESGDERRLLRSATGRRVGERRGEQRPVAPPPELPNALARHLSFMDARPLSPRCRRDMEGTRLALALQAGAMEALAALHDLYYDELRAYFRRSLEDHHEGEDLAHETLLRAHEEIAKWEHRGRPFRVWLFAVGDARLRRHLRRSARVDPTAPHDLIALSDASQPDWEGLGGWSALDGLDSTENPVLAEALAGLSQPHRRIIALRYQLGFTPSEAALVLGVSIGALYKAEQRILARLGGELAPRRSPTRPARRQPMSRRMPRAPVMAARRFALFNTPPRAIAPHRYR